MKRVWYKRNQLMKKRQMIQTETKMILVQILLVSLLFYYGNAEYHHPRVLEEKKPPIPILKQNFEQHDEGYEYSYETGNGIHAEQIGYIKNKGEKHETLVQKGSITYHDEHGHPFSLHYIADEHGFRVQGNHLPTPPPQNPEPQYYYKN